MMIYPNEASGTVNLKSQANFLKKIIKNNYSYVTAENALFN